MKQFIAKYAEKINGVLSGFDRLVLRGSLRAICYAKGMKDYLGRNHVLLKDFGSHVEHVSTRLKEASLKHVQSLGRKVEYLASSATDQEALARRIAHEDGITEGPVCVLTCVEPCASFEIFRNRETKHLDLVPRWRKCLFLYHYSIHPEFGFMHARIQTWFPFPIQICLNGREWLSRQMDAAGLGYVRQDNCFPWIEDFARAQALFDQQLRVNWPTLLDAIALELDPSHTEIFKSYRVQYYWSAYQTEWATDIVFKDAAFLHRLYEAWVHHAMTTFRSPDVLRFLGRRIPLSGNVPARFAGEVLTSFKRREEGVRIKHWLDNNSMKLYDKAFTAMGNVLRPECTINNVDCFKAFRPKEGEPDGPMAWRPLRRGIADLHRRADIAQHVNERYLDALASVDDDTKLHTIVDALERPVTWNGKRVRALHPFSPEDAPLLEIISDGKFTINGFRNKDLQAELFRVPPASLKERRRRSAQVSRKLRLLRAHGLIQKVPHEHRYHLTPNGRKIITALLSARNASTRSLTPTAA